MDSLYKELFLNPAGFEIRSDVLQEFERGLDPFNPELSKIPCRVLGAGEISTAFEIQVDGMQNLAFKRIPIFQGLDELQNYLATYKEYNHRLENIIGLHLPAHGYATCMSVSGRPVFYIIQEKLPPSSIGSNAIHHLTQPDIVKLFEAILLELHKIWAYNYSHSEAQVGIDGQISNWAITGFDRNHPRLGEDITLYYLDTSTPLCCQAGIEQLNPELFLRSAPPYLVWILRLLFVKDVATRYYDPRKVIIDVIANFHKEQMAQMIQALINQANNYIAHQGAELHLQPVTKEEVDSYYREDKIIWSLYLSMRRFDRFIRRRVLHRDYPYILPGKIQR